jgi:hypothetical protein
VARHFDWGGVALSHHTCPSRRGLPVLERFGEHEVALEADNWLALRGRGAAPDRRCGTKRTMVIKLLRSDLIAACKLRLLWFLSLCGEVVSDPYGIPRWLFHAAQAT